MNTNSIQIKLTEVQIRNGNLDIDATNKNYFPSDCFGDRSKTSVGRNITLIYGTNKIQTDIRIKSSRVLSPRNRFGSWFQQSLKAKPGDSIIINKLNDREYSLSFKRKS